jgi:hypothetical protein
MWFCFCRFYPIICTRGLKLSAVPAAWRRRSRAWLRQPAAGLIRRSFLSERNPNGDKPGGNLRLARRGKAADRGSHAGGNGPLEVEQCPKLKTKHLKYVLRRL